MNGSISFEAFRNYDYDTKRCIKVLLPGKNNEMVEETLYFNINLIPLNRYDYIITNTESVCVNKTITWPVEGDIYEYDPVNCQLYLINYF